MKEAPAGTECTCGSRLTYASGHDVRCPVYKAVWHDPARVAADIAVQAVSGLLPDNAGRWSA